MKEVTSFRCKRETKQKIDELRKRKKVQEDNYKINNSEIIEKAIDYYHSQTFGDKERDRIIEMLEKEIRSSVEITLKNFMGEMLAMFQIMNNDLYKNQIYNEVILKILVQKLDVDTSERALYSYTNNTSVFKDEVEKKIKNDLPTLYQYYKTMNEAREKYFKEEQKEKASEDEEGIIRDADHLPF